MKITLNWLREYVDVDWDLPELVERLTMSGLEYEAVEDLGEHFGGVVVGAVLSRAQHPNADRLSVCEVDLGAGDPSTIICGAPNVDAGQRVAVVTPGQRLPDGTEIRTAEIRGVTSNGMICSEVELGLGDDASGILVLPDSFRVGAAFAAAAGLDDVVIEFEVTPNRPDCLSLVGIAREVGALNGAALRLPFPDDMGESGDPAADTARIDIEDAGDCPRYAGRIIRGVSVGPSPAWLQNRLRAVGLRPINNVVDVTNFVMMELGQPLHAFDLAHLRESRIVVRRARTGERLTVLDGSEHELDDEILVIADGQRPVALAGIMGGANSEVSAGTTDILLESAHFAPAIVRRGAARLGLSTDASARFERGTDWALPPLAADRAARLIADTAGGTVAPGVLDAYPQALSAPTIHLRPDRLNALLSTALDGSACADILKRLGCRVETSVESLSVTVPSFRPDLTREADLIEEVGRIYGYHHIDGADTVRSPVPSGRADDFDFWHGLRRRMVGLGLDEVVTSTIVERSWLEIAGDRGLELANPPTESQCLLRTTLIPSLLDVARRNVNQRADSVAVFELGKCFVVDGDGDREELCLSGLWTGAGSASSWRGDRRPVDFLDLKGLIDTFLADVGPRYSPEERALFRSGHCARIEADGRLVGHMGEAASDAVSAFDLSGPVYIFELSGAALAEMWRDRSGVFAPLPKFPPISRDLAVVVDQAIRAQDLMTEIRAVEPDLIESVDLFDLYTGDQIADDRKSLAFSMQLRSSEKTLEDRQADEVMSRVISRLQKRFGAELRA